VPVAMYAMIRTGSRGEIFALGPSFLLLCILWRRERPVLAYSLIALLLIAPIIYVIYSSAIGGRFSAEAISQAVGVRWHAMGISAKNFAQRIVIGYGPADVGYQLQSAGIPLRYSHNAFLDAFNELGIIGGMLYLAVYLKGIKGYLQAFRLSKGSSVRAPVTACLVLTVFWTVLLLKSGSYYGGYLLFYFLGIGIVAPGIVRTWNEQYAYAEAEPYEPELLMQQPGR